MALEAITSLAGGEIQSMEILAAATAANSPPASAGAGASLQALWSALGGGVPAEGDIRVKSTAGSDTMGVKARVWWLFGTTAADWAIGDDLNAAALIGEADTDKIRFSQPFKIAKGATRVYLEVYGFTGTATAVEGHLAVRRLVGGL